MLPDAKWLDALALPARIMGGLASAFIFVLLLDRFGVLQLNDFSSLARPSCIVLAILSGCLFLASAIGALINYGFTLRQRHRLAKRRETLKTEETTKKIAKEEEALRRLDFLDEREIRYVAHALRQNTQTIYTYIHDPPISSMIAKGLMTTPGGEHDQDDYPFYFRDFAWKALIERRDELVAKDDVFEAARRPRRR